MVTDCCISDLDFIAETFALNCGLLRGNLKTFFVFGLPKILPVNFFCIIHPGNNALLLTYPIPKPAIRARSIIKQGKITYRFLILLIYINLKIADQVSRGNIEV